LICIGGAGAACFGVTFALHIYRLRTSPDYRYLVDEDLHERRLLEAVREHQLGKR
jgi:hypothetical protein